MNESDDICHVEAIQKDPTAEELMEIQTVYLEVRGMRCPNCALRVRNGLLSLYGVLDADVDHTLGLAEVSFNPRLSNTPALLDAVARCGSDGYHVYYATFSRQSEVYLI